MLPPVNVVRTGEYGAPIYLGTYYECSGRSQDSILAVMGMGPMYTHHHFENAAFFDLATGVLTPRINTQTEICPVRLLNDQVVLGFTKLVPKMDFTISTFGQNNVLPQNGRAPCVFNQLVKHSENTALALNQSGGILYKLTVQICNNEINLSNKKLSLTEEKKADDYYTGLAIFDDMREASEPALKDAMLCKLDDHKLVSIKNHSATRRCTVKVWATATFQCIDTIEVNAKLDEVIPSDDGRTLIGVTKNINYPMVHFIDLLSKQTQTEGLAESKNAAVEVVLLSNNHLLVLSDTNLTEFQWANQQLKAALSDCIVAATSTARDCANIISGYVGSITTNLYSFYNKNEGVQPYFVRANRVVQDQDVTASNVKLLEMTR